MNLLVLPAPWYIYTLISQIADYDSIDHPCNSFVSIIADIIQGAYLSFMAYRDYRYRVFSIVLLTDPGTYCIRILDG